MTYTFEAARKQIDNPQDLIRVCHVIGAGGTGARLVPLLVKVLSERDHVVIWDDDSVETRNLARQHFAPEDVGVPKAIALQRRYHRLANGPSLHAVTEKFSIPAFIRYRQIAGHDNLFFGCSDSVAFRREWGQALGAARMRGRMAITHAYIDMGNETRNGHALLVWGQMMLARCTVWDSALKRVFAFDSSLTTNDEFLLRMDNTGVFPELFGASTPAASEEGANCGIRLDLQTVAVNNMAAACGLNLALPFLYPGVAMRNMGAMFTTFNTLSPILPTAYKSAVAGIFELNTPKPKVVPVAAEEATDGSARVVRADGDTSLSSST